MPDLAQAVIIEIVHDIDVDAYMDDCMLFTDKDFAHHVDLIDKLLTTLAEAGMKCNPVKCAWAVHETNFLGYWITPTTVKPMKKKIDAFLKVDHPQNCT